jgi:hypothetical protein
VAQRYVLATRQATAGKVEAHDLYVHWQQYPNHILRIESAPTIPCPPLIFCVVLSG